VKPYFEKWIQKWPTLKDLANASMDDVLQVWAGLGYYSRARRLVEGAQYVIKEFDGVLPKIAEDLLKIPGIGPYTAGAISSIAYNQPEALVDGNVVRVLSRLRALGMNPKSKEATALHWYDDLSKVISLSFNVVKSN
jgi:A/G-specific adenine glycosylase